MKKVLSVVLIILLYCQSFAQLDREHWFAPMVDRVGNGPQYQSIYMSTNEVTPFKVDIYFNNAVVGSVTISKNNPVKYSISSSDRSRIITTSQTDLFKPVAMGFFLKGEKPYYASLRFSIYNHAEIQTSKGNAALGTEFRAVVAPITVNNGILNFMNSVMATEDNTTVTITDFRSNVRFSDGITRSQITFTLNRGQSYIIEGIGNNSANYTGYIGAKIKSDKPIVIANGNFNGQYAGNYPNGSDILMDQGVPIDKLGQEFVLVKGNGSPGYGMEKAIVVATEDNTQVYLNNGTTPVATLNVGQYYTTDTSAYIDQGAGHANMFIKATKNIYVYQLLAGTNNSSGGTEEATGGMNYIPPLSCYLPKKIDEIGKIEENQYASNTSASTTVPTKLNIITERGATVNVTKNGTPITLTASNGPFPVTGNSNWVTYSISNVTGNIAVFSTNAVTAGISAGDNSVGYGGYFAGFSYIPAVIKREGECLPGVKLEVTEGFSSYQWLIKSGTTYLPAPGINNTNIYEPTQAGIYAVKIQQGSCPEIQTQDFKFYNCTSYTNTDYNICSTVTITPAFSLSTQSVVQSTIKIDTPPTKGTAVIMPNGTIVYTANPNQTGTDTFKYSFCGNGVIADCETAQANITLNQVVFLDTILEACSNTPTAEYDLTKTNVTAATDVTKVYYKTRLGAENETVADLISTPTTYISVNTKVYVRLKSTLGCVSIAEIELKSKPLPVINPNLYTALHCDEEIDGIIDGNYKVDVTQITPIVLQNPTIYVVKYYDDVTKANAGGTDNIVGNFTFTANRKIWIRVESANGCLPIIEAIDLKIGTKLTLINDPVDHIICSINNANTEIVTLSDYINLLTTAPGSTATYFKTLADAQANTAAITVQQTIPEGITTFYYRLAAPNFCVNIGALNLNLKKGDASTTLPATITICENSTTLLDVGTGFSAGHVWYNETNPTTSIGSGQTITVGPGKYFVDITSPSGCVYRQYVEVIGFKLAQLNTSLYNAIICDDNLDGNITVKFAEQVTPVILQNSVLFNVRYYDTLAKANAGLNNNLPNTWTYSTDTKIWVRVDSPFCPYITSIIDFKIGNRITLLKLKDSAEVCDDDLDGQKEINLSDYKNLFTTNAALNLSYYNTRLDAQNKNNPLTNPIIAIGTKSYFLRFESTTACPEIAELVMTVKVPKESTVLKDQEICPDAITTLDAGMGYQGYAWYDEKDPTTSIGSGQTVDVGLGNYFVDLTAPNRCVYRQKVKVSSSKEPKITAIAIEENTVTITVADGTSPYLYALDNGNYQTSNVFYNVTKGPHTIYVKYADNCGPIDMDFAVISPLNAFTPNDDGYNDVVDYRELLTKTEPKVIIIDRYGKKVFDSDITKTFIWDGKLNGITLPTDTYWYIMNWKEFGVATPVQKKGWILLKAR